MQGRRFCSLGSAPLKPEQESRESERDKMLRSAASKVMWVGRVTVFLVGLAMILALIFGVASTALGANGDFFKVGKTNCQTRQGVPDRFPSTAPAAPTRNSVTQRRSASIPSLRRVATSIATLSMKRCSPMARYSARRTILTLNPHANRNSGTKQGRGVGRGPESLRPAFFCSLYSGPY